jgi:hypothetical protein
LSQLDQKQNQLALFVVQARRQTLDELASFTGGRRDLRIHLFLVAWFFRETAHHARAHRWCAREAIGCLVDEKPNGPTKFPSNEFVQVGGEIVGGLVGISHLEEGDRRREVF